MNSKVTFFSSEGYCRYLVLCLALLVSQSVSECISIFQQRCAMSYGAVTLVLIAPLSCSQNSVTFLCKASFSMMKIDHFRARAINHSVLFTYMRPIHPPWSAAARRVPRVSGQGWLRGVILVQQTKL